MITSKNGHAIGFLVESSNTVDSNDLFCGIYMQFRVPKMTVHVGSSKISTTRTLIWVQEGSYPAVDMHIYDEHLRNNLWKP